MRSPNPSGYHLTPSEYVRLREHQSDMCAICGSRLAIESEGLTAEVDHDRALELAGVPRRETVRGLLCVQCNRGLGFFRDSPQRLARAIEYLAAHRLRHAVRQPPPWLETVVPSGDQITDEQIRDRLFAAISSAPRPPTAAELRRGIAVRYLRVSVALRDLELAGAIERVFVGNRRAGYRRSGSGGLCPG